MDALTRPPKPTTDTQSPGPYTSAGEMAVLRESVRGGRVTLRRYRDYMAAQRCVDALSDDHFPVEHTAIVGENLKIVEQITGRLNWGKAALAGIASGAVTGAFIGFLFGLFSLIDPLVSGFVVAGYGALIGAVAGLVFGLIGYSATGGRRDFTSIGGMVADDYVVQVDADQFDKAEQVLVARGL